MNFIIQQRFAMMINKPEQICMIKTMKLRKRWFWYEKHMLKFLNKSIKQSVIDIMWLEGLMK